MDTCFVDVETTGTDSGRHQIWEVALIGRGPGGDVEYCWQIRPDLAGADPHALRIGRYRSRCRITAAPVGVVATITGPPDEPVRSVDDAAELAVRIAELLDGAVLVGVNVAFDRDFLAAFCTGQRECLTVDYHLRDVCALAAGWLHAHHRPVPAGWRSDDLAAAIGIDPAAYDRHTALGDARFARAIYDTITGTDTPAALARMAAA